MKRIRLIKLNSELYAGYLPKREKSGVAYNRERRAERHAVKFYKGLNWIERTKLIKQLNG